jgi:hypothetical protein
MFKTAFFASVSRMHSGVSRVLGGILAHTYTLPARGCMRCRGGAAMVVNEKAQKSTEPRGHTAA